MNKQVVTLLDENKEQVIPVTKASVTYMDDGNSVEATIRNLKEDAKYKGYFKNEEALLKAFPNNILKPELRDGWYVSIGTTDTFWLWDSDDNRWEDSKSYTSPVTSVNGKTGEVTLTGEDINATPTIEDVGVTKPITQHLETLYNKVNKNSEPLIIDAVLKDNKFGAYDIVLGALPDEYKGKVIEANINLIGQETSYKPSASVWFSATFSDGELRGRVLNQVKGINADTIDRIDFNYKSGGTYRVLLFLLDTNAFIQFTDTSKDYHLLSKDYGKFDWISYEPSKYQVTFEILCVAISVVGFNKINDDGSLTSAIVDYTITKVDDRRWKITITSEQAIGLRMLYALK